MQSTLSAALTIAVIGIVVVSLNTALDSHSTDTSPPLPSTVIGSVHNNAPPVATSPSGRCYRWVYPANVAACGDLKGESECARRPTIHETGDEKAKVFCHPTQGPRCPCGDTEEMGDDDDEL